MVTSFIVLEPRKPSIESWLFVEGRHCCLLTPASNHLVRLASASSSPRSRDYSQREEASRRAARRVLSQSRLRVVHCYTGQAAGKGQGLKLWSSRQTKQVKPMD